MFQQFIHRPVLSIVISLIITLLGVLAITQLPMTLFPNIAPPEVNVEVEYTGANAETVTKAAIVTLERAINGVPGMKYMSSDAGNDGVGVIQIIFETGTNADLAAVNVQTRVSDVLGEMPEEVVRAGIAIGKEENAMLMYLNIFSNDPKLEEKFLYNFADINILAELKRVPGVGYANIVGAKTKCSPTTFPPTTYWKPCKRKTSKPRPEKWAKAPTRLPKPCSTSSNTRASTTPRKSTAKSPSNPRPRDRFCG
jgi:HAE1 family hydrophobic/amphiphilic exporter-1